MKDSLEDTRRNRALLRARLGALPEPGYPGGRKGPPKKSRFRVPSWLRLTWLTKRWGARP